MSPEVLHPFQMETKMKILLIALIVLLMASMVQAESIQLIWGKVTNTPILRYVLYRSVTEVSGYAAIDSTAATDTSRVDLNVVAGTRYYYKAQAVGTDLQRSPLSGSISGVFLRTTDLQSVVVASAAKIATGNYRVVWTSTVATTGLLQYKLVGATNWIDTPRDNVSGTSHTITLTGLSEPASYVVRAAGYTTGLMTVSVPFTFATAPAPVAPIWKELRPF